VAAEVVVFFVVGTDLSVRTARSGCGFGIGGALGDGTELLFDRLFALTGPASSA
jgi:hypothetical protein